MSPALRIGLMASLLAGIFVTGGCSSPPRCPPGASCPAVIPRVTFVPAINGQSVPPQGNGHPPRFQVRTGERLVIRVTMIVPRHLTVTALWFGMSAGFLGGGPNGTGSMHPILAHYPQPLAPGPHVFALRWRAPERRPGASLYLAAAWNSRHPPGSIAQFVAQLMLK